MEPTTSFYTIGTHASVAVAPDDSVHVAYRNGMGVTWAVRRNGAWTKETFTTSAFPTGLALAVNAAGEPMILVAADNLALYRRQGNAFVPEVLKPGSATELTLLLDSAGRPHLTFHCTSEQCGQQPGGSDKFRYRRHNGSTWEELEIATSNVRQGSFALDSRDAPHFVYAQALALRYAHYGITAPSFDTTSQTIGLAGGTLRSADGLAELDVPPGALSTDTLLSIRRIPRAQWPSGVDPNAPTPVYELLPDGTTFAVPATGRLIFPVEAMLAANDVSGMSLPTVTVVSGGNAEDPVSVDFNTEVAAGTLEFPVDHFTEFRTTSRVGTFVRIDVPTTLGVGCIGDIGVTFTPSLSAFDARVTATPPLLVREYFDGDTFVCTAAGTALLTVHVYVPAAGSGAPEFRHTENRFVRCVTSDVMGSFAAFTQILVGPPAVPLTDLDRVRDSLDVHPEEEYLVDQQDDHTQFVRVGSAVVDLAQSVVDALFNTASAPYACHNNPSDRVLCSQPTTPMPAGPYIVTHAVVAAPIPDDTPESSLIYSLLLDDDGPGYLPAANAPSDGYGGAGKVVSAVYSALPQGWEATVQRSNTTVASLLDYDANVRIAIQDNFILFVVPFSALQLTGTTVPGYRMIVSRHTGAFGRGNSRDFSLDMRPPLQDGFAPLVDGTIESITTNTPSYTLQKITAADGSEAPGGATLFNELRLGVNIGIPGVSAAVFPQPGGQYPGIDFELDGTSDPDCIEQWDGDEWRELSEVGSDGFARFRAKPLGPSTCAAVIEARCAAPTVTPPVDGGMGSADAGTTDGGGGPGPGGGAPPGGIDCPMGGPPPFGSTTVNVSPGSITRFFIQTPDRICEDGEPTEFRLGRYGKGPAASPIGMAVDLYVCAQTSWGAWLRYDVLSDDNPEIVWSGPPDPDPNDVDHSPRFLSGSSANPWSGEVTGSQGGGTHGYIRVNYHELFEPTGLHPQPDTGTITATGRAHVDTITLRKVGTLLSGGGTPSRIGEALEFDFGGLNIYAPGQTNACTQLPPNGTNPVRGCFFDGMTQHVEVYALMAEDEGGTTSRVHVGTDERVNVGVTGRDRMVTFGNFAGNQIAYQRLEALCYGGGLWCTTNTPTPVYAAVLKFAPALLTATHPAINITPPPASLQGVGASAPLHTVATFTLTGGATVDVDVSYIAQIQVSNATVVGLYQGGSWTDPPAGLIAPSGTRNYQQVFEQALPVAQMVGLSVRVPPFAGADATVWSVAP